MQVGELLAFFQLHLSVMAVDNVEIEVLVECLLELLDILVLLKHFLEIVANELIGVVIGRENRLRPDARVVRKTLITVFGFERLPIVFVEKRRHSLDIGQKLKEEFLVRVLSLQVQY